MQQSSIFAKIFFGILLFLTYQLSYATTVVISGNTPINNHTSYENVTLDMTNGSFTLQQNGILIIKNSIVNVTLSPSNPFFAMLNGGKLIMINSTVNTTTSGITANPDAKQPFELVLVSQGGLVLKGNNIAIDQNYMAGFVDTQDLATTDFVIANNSIKNFHGGLYLINSDSPSITENTFDNVSFSNVFLNGHLATVERNTFTFPGYLHNGDAVDVINANGITIADNIVASSSGYGFYILGGANILIDNNKITDGKSYAIFIDTPVDMSIKKHAYLAKMLGKRKMTFEPNQNISISSNYISLNRYGITGGIVDGLNVTNNMFIQRFNTAAMRQFWTDNDVLLAQASNLDWTKNLYKEAFTQEVPGNNTNALQFVPFPAHGGVVLP